MRSFDTFIEVRRLLFGLVFYLVHADAGETLRNRVARGCEITPKLDLIGRNQNKLLGPLIVRNDPTDIPVHSFSLLSLVLPPLTNTEPPTETLEARFKIQHKLYCLLN